jgi:PST family polysaccharide transporter
VRVITELAYDFLVALGRPRPNLWLQIIWCLFLVPALILGARWHGVIGVATGHAVVAVGVMIPAYLIALSRVGVSIRRVVANSARPVLGSALIVGSGLVILDMFPANLVKLAVGGVVGLVLYIAVVHRMRVLLRTSDLLIAPTPVTQE